MNLANITPFRNNCRIGSRHIALVVAVISSLTVANTAISSSAKVVSAGEGNSRDVAEVPAKREEPGGPGIRYRLDTGDHLRVRFYDRYDREDLNGDYVIGESGQLRLPRVGSFDARNQSTPELEHDIREAVEKRGEKLGFFSVEVTRCRPFYVAGYANRPGSYAYVPGLTVLHAVSLAGGFYRSPMTSVADAMRERRTLTESLSRIMELTARKGRLIAERDDAVSIAMPKELVQLEPFRAGELIDSERTVLQRSREADRRERTGFESVIALTKSQVETYSTELVRVEQRIVEQTAVFTQLKKLREDKVINQQRFFEAVSALDGVQRDKQTALAGLSRANADLEKGQRDLAMLTLARNARIAKELTETERELTRLKTVAAQTRELVSGLDTLANKDGSGQVVSYKILRRDETGKLTFVSASETTPIMPGDLIQVESRAEPAPSWLN